MGSRNTAKLPGDPIGDREKLPEPVDNGSDSDG